MNGLEYYFRHDRGAYWIGKSLLGDHEIGRAINPFLNHASDKHNLSHRVLRQIFDYNKGANLHIIIGPEGKMGYGIGGYFDACFGFKPCVYPEKELN